MRAVGRRRLGIFAHTLVGTVLGTITAFWLGRAILQRTATTVLNDYAQMLAEHAGQLSGELKTTFHQLNASVFPYCSDQQLAELQSLTFHSSLSYLDRLAVNAIKATAASRGRSAPVPSPRRSSRRSLPWPSP